MNEQEPDNLRPADRCNKWGGCRLPRGHNDGKPENPQAHGALLPAAPSGEKADLLAEALDAWGAAYLDVRNSYSNAYDDVDPERMAHLHQAAHRLHQAWLRRHDAAQADAELNAMGLF